MKTFTKTSRPTPNNNDDHFTFLSARPKCLAERAARRVILKKVVGNNLENAICGEDDCGRGEFSTG